MAVTPPSREAILATTRDILNQPAFQSGTGWQQRLEGLRDWLERTLVHLTDWLRAHPLLQGLVVVGLLLLLGLFLFHLVRLVREEVRWRRRSEGRDQAPVSATVSEPGALGWEAMMREVRAALQRGDGYLAIWHLHRWFLVWLDGQGCLRFIGWKTNADYLRECPATHPVYTTLEALSRTYDQIVYAHRDIPLETIATLLAQVEHVRHSSGS